MEPASPAQQGMWFLHQLAPASPFYNVPMAVAFETGWDVGAVSAAVQRLVARHDVLRVTYTLGDDGLPAQVIADTLEIPVPVAERPRGAGLDGLAQDLFQAPFDLERGPLLRAQAVTTGAASGVLLLTLHHSVCDHWSLNLIGQELRALVRGEEPPPPGQYSDFARWQQASLRDGELAAQLEHWRGRLAGAPPVIDLPSDRQRSATTSFRGATRRARLGPRLSRAVEGLARSQGATVFMTLMAAFDVLLHRSGRQSDIVVGTWIAGRNRTEHERTVGAFANTLLVRADLSDSPPFTDLLAQVRERVLEALAHQDVRIETLVRELAPARTAAHMPLCQVVYTHQNLPDDTLAARRGSRRRSAPAVTRNSTKYDLVLFSQGEGSPDGLDLRLEYSSDLFDDATAIRLLAAFERVLEQVTAEPTIAVGSVDLLGPEERRRVVVEWNHTDAPFPRRATLPGLFREQAKRAPEAVALRHGDRVVTAATLDAGADRVAERLLAAGVRPGDVVAVSGPRTPELIAGMLGVMRAGAAYLPLDPAYPAARLRLMLEDARARAVLTVEERPLVRTAEPLPLEGCLDGPPVTPVELPGPPPDVAYVVYTSGSTGRPKGVMGRHRATVNRLAWQWRQLPYREGEVCVQKTAISFVDSVAEVFGPLLRGVPLELVDDAEARDPFRLLNRLAATGATRIVLVPSLLRSLLEVEPDLASAVPALTTWVTSGEALSGELAERFRTAHPQARLINLYGSSEVAADATWHEVDEVAGGEPVPIGRPIANTSVFVLDAYRRPAPIGATGEIWVAGEGLAAGYIHRPDLTADRFVELGLEGRRVRAYRTGDLGRFRRDGVLLYAGRADHQLKVRGVRVEPREVEAVLRRVRGVTGALVVGRGPADDLRLVAYLETAGGREVVEAARAAADRHLPGHARPSAYVSLTAFPLTPNGKVNRLALPAPPEHDARAGARYEAPRNDAEGRVAAVFAEVLGVAEVGIHDDFFALGGHSLTATQAVARLRLAFARDLPLAVLFEAPTVAALAQRLEEQTAAGTAPPAAAIERAPGARAALSFSQRRLWFLDQLQPGSPAYHIAQTFRFRGRLPADAYERALDTIVARHEVLRTTFGTEDGEPVQVIAPELRIRLRAVDLRGLAVAERRAEAQRLARENFALPFDLARGPLLRGTLVDLDESEQVLFLCVHHIVSDGWSMDLLDGELAALLAADGGPPVLPPLPVQYADFARWQRSLLRGEALERELRHWRSRLAGAPAQLNLPTDRPRPAVQSLRGERVVRLLSRRVRRAVDAFAREHDATAFMALLAAFAAVVGRWSGQDDVVIGSPVAGRTRIETERLVGFFVNTVALRTDLAGDPSFAELVERVRAVALEAYEHQDLPFERLVEEMAPERDLSRSPLFQVMFVLQNTRAAAARQLPVPAGPRPGDLRRVHWDHGAHASKFDLTLTAVEQPRGLRLQLEFAADLFDSRTMQRFLDHFEVLLDAALAAPATPVSRLPLLKPGERAQLDAWSATPGELGPDTCLHAGFAQQVRARRHEVAVVHEGRRVSYEDLDRMASSLAARLAATGVERGDRVGIRLERTPAMVAAVLAVLRLGATYVPLDPAAPPARGRFILQDAGARACIGALEGAPCPIVDPILEGAPASARGRRAGVKPNDVAYVLYTSGSTGKPKGVLVEHRQVVGYCRAVARATGAGEPGIRFAMLQPLHVDSSVTALWGSLLTGGELHLVTPETAADARRLASLLRRERIDHLKIAPSHLRALHTAGDPRRLMPRRWLVIGGEGSPWEWVRTLPRLRRGCRVFNHYGPTETTVGVTVYPVNPNVDRRHEISPIGRPLANARAYVLDAHGRPQPVGVPGELHLGGAAVARGYCGRPELDAERFLPDPTVAGGRMYRTGDLCRWLATGDLEFLGRLDHQVKIRGFRIELGEIEAALNRHPGVAEGLVQAREDRRGERRLVAWVAGRAGRPAPSAADLRAHLRRDLPEVMIPAAFVILDRLPLTPHGKVDLQALPSPRFERAAVAHVPPRTDSEKALAAIWRDVLGLDVVGADGHFFELGGHSLLATQVISRVRDHLGVEVPLRAIFEEPTLAGLAGLVDGLRN